MYCKIRLKLKIRHTPMWFVWAGILALCLIVCVCVNRIISPEMKIFNVYRKESPILYKLKFYASFIYLLWTRRYRHHIGPEVGDKIQTLLAEKNDYLFETITFMGTSSTYFVFECIVNLYTTYSTARLTLRLPQFNDDHLCVSLTNNSYDGDIRVSKGMCIRIDGLEMTVIVPLEKWAIKFCGNMRFAKNPSKEVHVEFDGVWNFNFSSFSYDKEMSSLSISKAISNELWAKDYFRLLEWAKPIYNEQYGEISGTVQIDEHAYMISANSIKRHVLGRFNYRKMLHRSVMHYITLDSGDQISVAVGSFPQLFSKIEYGFISIAENGKNYPIEKCDLRLHCHGEEGNPPLDYAFSFETKQTLYRVKVYGPDIRKIQYNEEYNQTIVIYNCIFEVNDILGWGLVEWCYKITSK